MGKGTVRFVTLYAIQTLYLSKPVDLSEVYLSEMTSQKAVYLVKCRVCGEAPYVGEAKVKFRVRFNNCKIAHRSYRKKRKVSLKLWATQSHSHNEMIIGSSH